MKTSVLVIGAGASGLAAAKRLAEAKCTVTVLEARDRLGGRIWSHDPWDEGKPIELGAEFIHDSVLAQCFSKSGLIPIHNRQRVDWRWCRYQFGGRRIPRCNASRRVGLVMDERWYVELSRARTSVAQALRKWPALARAMARTDVEALYAADANHLNARALHEQYVSWQGGNTEWRPLGGYGPLIDKLKKGLGIHQADPVMRVERLVELGVVRVTTRNGKRFEGRRAVVTVPLGVLKRNAIRFSPRLSPVKRAAIQGIGMGEVVKIAVQCRPFWGKCRFISSDRDVPVWWPLPQQRGRNGVIIGWAAGSAAAKLGRLEIEDIKQKAVSSLQELFGKSVDVCSDEVCVVDWSADKFTRGAYTYDRIACGSVLRWQLAKPEDGLLFFAGEATEPLYYGTVHGAVTSGEKAAARVLESLGACA